MTYDRFEHEQQIMTCWAIVDELKTINEGVLEKDLSPDQVANMLSGLSALYQLKFEKLFALFEASI